MLSIFITSKHRQTHPIGMHALISFTFTLTTSMDKQLPALETTSPLSTSRKWKETEWHRRFHVYALHVHVHVAVVIGESTHIHIWLLFVCPPPPPQDSNDNIKEDVVCNEVHTRKKHYYMHTLCSLEPRILNTMATGLQFFIRAAALTLLLVHGFTSAAPVQEEFHQSREATLQQSAETDAELRLTRSTDGPNTNLTESIRSNNGHYMLFAYSEMLEAIYPRLLGRKKRQGSTTIVTDPENKCSDVEYHLGPGKAVPTTVQCPFKCKCNYDYNRYPRYVISAVCDAPADGIECKQYGRQDLQVLKRSEPGGAWVTYNNIHVYQGCQKRIDSWRYSKCTYIMLYM